MLYEVITGARVEDAVGSLMAMQGLDADQVRAMTFVPQAGTPMADMPRLGSTYETNLIAVMRLLFPHACIPASLDVEGIQGLKDRLNAGANIVTSIIPPRITSYNVCYTKLLRSHTGLGGGETSLFEMVRVLDKDQWPPRDRSYPSPGSDSGSGSATAGAPWRLLMRA